MLTAFRDAMLREKRRLLAQVIAVRGLMPLLMKRRNGERWSPEDRAQLRVELARLSELFSYLAVFMLPGGMLLLPALAWWLDRRRNRRTKGDVAARVEERS